MTRSRRSSMSSDSQPTKAKRPTKRQSMLPAVTEEKPVGKTPATKTARAGKKELAVSPSKKFSKASSKALREEDILEVLDQGNEKKVVSPVVKAKSPKRSRIPIKSPPSESKKQKASTSTVRRSRRISGDLGSLPAVDVSVKKSRKSMLPAISEVKSPAKAQPKSPAVDNVLKDVKRVEIKLRRMKIKEDPNLIFSLLEESAQNDRVEEVVGQILQTKKESSPVTRQGKTETPKPKVATPKVKTETPKPKPKVVTPKVAPKKPEAEEVLSSKKRKQTESNVKTPLQNKRLKLDKSVSEGQETEKRSPRKTPTLLSQYKQKTPVGSLRKPLKRLQVAKSTPAQVRPSDVLRRNMIKKVEKEIVAKLSKKPDSSPYTLNTDENSPVFQSVKDVKSHITGTPARPRPRRKFGTVVQPESLLEESVATAAELERRVSSSTPVRPNLHGAHPLEAVEATPIRPPVVKQPPLSPEPEMVTGKLGYLCTVM